MPVSRGWLAICREVVANTVNLNDVFADTLVTTVSDNAVSLPKSAPTTPHDFGGTRSGSPRTASQPLLALHM